MGHLCSTRINEFSLTIMYITITCMSEYVIHCSLSLFYVVWPINYTLSSRDFSSIHVTNQIFIDYIGDAVGGFVHIKLWSIVLHHGNPPFISQ
jgi:hypothetical protein